MSSQKLSPEEELEKQYREYKAQFEEWREKNKGSEGTDGYIKYVKQFEMWEQDVERRRRAVRARTEQDRRQAVQPEETHSRHQISEEDAAARYAEQQKSYVAMHQRAMQEEERQREQRLRVVQPAEEETVKRGPHIQADPLRPAGFGDRDQKPPLWGPDGADFLPSDVMFARWNIRATPPNFKTVYQPPPPGAPITPSWYLMKKMEEKGLFYGYNVNLLGSAEVSLDGMPEPPRNGALRTDQPPPEQGPNLSVPPPAFSLALSGPTPADSFLGAGQPRPGVLFASADPAFAGRPPTVVLGVPPADFSVPPPLIPASQ